MCGEWFAPSQMREPLKIRKDPRLKEPSKKNAGERWGRFLYFHSVHPLEIDNTDGRHYSFPTDAGGSATMFCPKCGVELPDDSQFCRKCGNALTNTGAVGIASSPSKNMSPRV